MNRRETVLRLLALGGVPLIGSSPLSAWAQQTAKVWKIGYLGLSTQADLTASLNSFKDAFRALGYHEGRNYTLEIRFAENKLDQLPVLASELVRLKPDVIMTAAATPTLVVQKATSTIPIVMIGVGDPVGSGVVKSLARPGGNTTGLSNTFTDIATKHLDLLREIKPTLSRLSVLINPAYKSHRDTLAILQNAGGRIGVRVLSVEVGSAQEIEKGLSTLAELSSEAVIVIPDAIFEERRRQIADLALKSKVACVGFYSSGPASGFLFSYGYYGRQYRRAAIYVDKILKGAHPKDMPVEQPTNYQLVINKKTAETLGIKLPQSILLRADRVIEGPL